MDSSPRYETKEFASLEIYGGRTLARVRLKNLSTTGACLTWEDDRLELSKGDLVCVTVVLNEVKKKHRVNAQVVWSGHKESGLTFIPRTEVTKMMMTKKSGSRR